MSALPWRMYLLFRNPSREDAVVMAVAMWELDSDFESG